jgi:hypothetical protein
MDREVRDLQGNRGKGVIRQTEKNEPEKKMVVMVE